MGTEVTDRLVYCEKKDAYGSFVGLISPPGLDRGHAKHIWLMVNGRWVKDRVLKYGVMRGYHSHLLKGRFPIVIGNFSCDPALIDVNVHPAKTELRFQYAEQVQSLVASAVRETIRAGTWAGIAKQKDVETAPEIQFISGGDHDNGDRSLSEAPIQNKENFGRSGSLPAHSAPKSVAYSGTRDSARLGNFGSLSSFTNAPGQWSRGNSVSSEKSAAFAPVVSGKYGYGSGGFSDKQSPDIAVPDSNIAAASSANGKGMLGLGREGEHSFPSVAGEGAGATSLDGDLGGLSQLLGVQEPFVGSLEEGPIPWGELDFVGSFARCFLMFEHRECLLVVDQHAFHERILYERFKDEARPLGASERLTIAESITLPSQHVAALEEFADVIAGSGLEIKKIAEDVIEVLAVPSLLRNRDLESLLVEIANIKQGESPIANPEELGHLSLATLACHAAVRAGEDLGEQELRSLLRDAANVDFYLNCPHGRRVFKWWKKRDVAKWFDR